MTVGMKNGFGGIENFSRERVTDPKNPQTDAQTDNRIKMLPALLFRRQLANVITRGFEGVEYGGPSTRRFMKYAMKEPLENIPQVEKDTVLAIPGEYLVSKGSLGEITSEYDENAANFVTNLPAVQDDQQISSISEALINGGYAKEGDQVTAIGVLSLPDLSNLVSLNYRVLSFIVDTANNDDADDGYINLYGNQYGNLVISSASDNIIAGTVVISRNGTTPQRTTSRMGVAKNIESTRQYFGPSLKANVKQSYVKTQATRSYNWEYDTADEGGAEVLPIVQDTTLTLEVGDRIMAYVPIGGTKYVPYHNETISSQVVLISYRKFNDSTFTKTGGQNLGASAAQDEVAAELASKGYTLVSQAQLQSVASNAGVTIYFVD